jgi:hypothetical protein
MKKFANITTLVASVLSASFLVNAMANTKIDPSNHPNNEAAVTSIQSEYANAQQNTPLPISNTDFDRLVNEGINSQALQLALKAYVWADHKGALKNKRYMTLVDFSKPSNEPRLYVIDLDSAKVVFREYVSQGAGSGTGIWATHFSDVGDSHASELGAIVTENTYYGKHGLSLRLAGLEGINHNLENRAVVMHSANYATPEYAEENGRLGNSWGCFAMSPAVTSDVISVVKGGSFVFAYSPLLAHDRNYA